MEKDEFKLKWDYYKFNPIYTKTEKTKNQYNKIFEKAKSEISKFEKEHNIEIVIFFNHESNELSPYSCDPDNYETTMKLHLFLDELNHHLKSDLKYPQIVYLISECKIELLTESRSTFVFSDLK